MECVFGMWEGTHSAGKTVVRAKENSEERNRSLIMLPVMPLMYVDGTRGGPDGSYERRGGGRGNLVEA